MTHFSTPENINIDPKDKLIWKRKFKMIKKSSSSVRPHYLQVDTSNCTLNVTLCRVELKNGPQNLQETLSKQ